MPTSTTTTAAQLGPVASSSPQPESKAEQPAGHNEEIDALKRSLQEQRRATTLLNAEVQRQTEAREAAEAQLIEANAEIVTSWDRRKEMTRVIADRDERIVAAQAEIEAGREREQELSREIEAGREREQELAREIEAEREAGREREQELSREIEAGREREQELSREIESSRAEIAELRSEIKATRERRKEIAAVVANRDVKIDKLRAELQARQEALANRDGRIAKLKAELHARYEELATLQRHIARSSLSGRAKRLVRPVTRLLG